MSQQDSNSCTKTNHHLTFTIKGVTIGVDEMGQWAAGIVSFDSEADQEAFGRDVAHAIFRKFAGRVEMATAQTEHARMRRKWIKLHPPNHAGYYYCHIGGEWVHIKFADLEHIVPGSREHIDMDVPGWDNKLRMACRPHNSMKGSRQDVPSTTLVYAPPDEEC